MIAFAVLLSFVVADIAYVVGYSLAASASLTFDTSRSLRHDRLRWSQVDRCSGLAYAGRWSLAAIVSLTLASLRPLTTLRFRCCFISRCSITVRLSVLAYAAGKSLVAWISLTLVAARWSLATAWSLFGVGRSLVARASLSLCFYATGSSPSLLTCPSSLAILASNFLSWSSRGLGFVASLGKSLQVCDSSRGLLFCAL